MNINKAIEELNSRIKKCKIRKYIYMCISIINMLIVFTAIYSFIKSEKLVTLFAIFLIIDIIIVFVMLRPINNNNKLLKFYTYLNETYTNIFNDNEFDEIDYVKLDRAFEELSNKNYTYQTDSFNVLIDDNFFLIQWKFNELLYFDLCKISKIKTITLKTITGEKNQYEFKVSTPEKDNMIEIDLKLKDISEFIRVINDKLKDKNIEVELK